MVKVALYEDKTLLRYICQFTKGRKNSDYPVSRCRVSGTKDWRDFLVYVCYP